MKNSLMGFKMKKKIVNSDGYDTSWKNFHDVIERIAMTKFNKQRGKAFRQFVYYGAYTHLPLCTSCATHLVSYVRSSFSLFCCRKF